jgi:hypothetical protein
MSEVTEQQLEDMEALFVTLVRSAIRGLLRACDGELAAELRGLLRRDDPCHPCS